MGFYDVPTTNKPEMMSKGEKVFHKQFKTSYGIEGFTVNIDGKFQKDVIIQQHANPMNEQLQDKKMLFIPDEVNVITWGCVVEGYDNAKYLVITEPHTNGIYNSCKIRKMPEEAIFNVDNTECRYPCILNNSKLYTDGSYTGETNVFEEDDMRSLVVSYDSATSKFKLFDNIVVDSKEYKIVMIDDLTLRDYGEPKGVLQLALLRTIFGELKCNDVLIDGCLRYSKMKEKIYNSKARQLYMNHNVVNTGDYIKHTFTRDKDGNLETRTYIVCSEIDMRNEYDAAFCLLCDRETNLIDKDGNIVTYRLYINDNKSMIKASSIGEIEGKDTSSTWASIKADETTMNLGETITRILVKHTLGDKVIYKAYKIIGKDDLSLGGVIVTSLIHTDPNPKDNYETGIAYNENFDIPEPPTPPIHTNEILGSDELYFGYEVTNSYK